MAEVVTSEKFPILNMIAFPIFFSAVLIILWMWSIRPYLRSKRKSTYPGAGLLNSFLANYTLLSELAVKENDRKARLLVRSVRILILLIFILILAVIFI